MTTGTMSVGPTLLSPHPHIPTSVSPSKCSGTPQVGGGTVSSGSAQEVPRDGRRGTGGVDTVSSRPGSYHGQTVLFHTTPE